MRQALIVAVALAALVALPAATWAQAKPDFSGSWTMDPAKSDPAPARAGGGGGGGGGRGGGRGGGVAMQMTIKQTPTQLTIDRVLGQGTQTAVYKLDGTESTNTMGQGEAKSKAVWEGSKLVITTTRSFNGNSIETKEAYSLDGGTLTVEVTNNGPNGPTTRKIVYNKG